MVYDLRNRVRNSTFSVYASAHALDFAGVNRENMAAFAKALLLEGEEQETLWRV